MAYATSLETFMRQEVQNFDMWLGMLLYLFFQQYTCCQYGLLAGNDASDNGSEGGYDCLMIPGISAKLFMFSHT